MDRLIAPNTVTSGAADTAPVSGTPGYATSGNPATSTPATTFPAYQYNAIQEEILAVIAAAGITLDRTNNAQLLAALNSLHAPSGECRVSFVSTTSIKLSPYQGNRLPIAGVVQRVPAAGITIANTGLVASTLYYVYVFMNSGTMTLELSTTGHAMDAATVGNIGVEIKSGDPTRTLVGMIYTSANTPGQFSSFLVANWFNRKLVSNPTIGSFGGSTSSPTATEINSAGRVSFLNWGDEAINIAVLGSGSCASTIVLSTGIAIDNSTGIAQLVALTSSTSAANMNISHSVTVAVSEGIHYATVIGAVSNVSGGTWVGLGITVLTKG